MASEKTTDNAANATDKQKPEMGSSRSANQRGNSRSHPEANDERRERTRKTDATVPIPPGRDITPGSDGFDGKGREHKGDVDRNTTAVTRMRVWMVRAPGMMCVTANAQRPARRS